MKSQALVCATVVPMPRKRKSIDPPSYEPPEVSRSFPMFVYLIRLIHATAQSMIEEVYGTVKHAEEKIVKIFAEGFSHDLQIVRTWFFTPVSNTCNTTNVF